MVKEIPDKWKQTKKKKKKKGIHTPSRNQYRLKKKKEITRE